MKYILLISTLFTNLIIGQAFASSKTCYQKKQTHTLKLQTQAIEMQAIFNRGGGRSRLQTSQYTFRTSSGPEIALGTYADVEQARRVYEDAKEELSQKLCEQDINCKPIIFGQILSFDGINFDSQIHRIICKQK